MKQNNIDKEIHDTYYSKKNKKVLPTVIVLSCIFLTFNGSILFEIVLWGWYISYCNNNNQALRQDKANLKKREHLMKVKEYMEKEGK